MRHEYRVRVQHPHNFLFSPELLCHPLLTVAPAVRNTDTDGHLHFCMWGFATKQHCCCTKVVGFETVGMVLVFELLVLAWL